MRALPFLLSATALLAATAGLAEDQATRLTARAREAMTRLGSLQAEVELVQPTGTFTGKMLVKRPNLVRLELKGAQEELHVSTGSTYVRYYGKTNRYLETPNPSAVTLPGVGDFGFFQPPGSTAARLEAPLMVSHAGTGKLDGQEVEVLEQVAQRANHVVERLRFFISPEDFLVRRVERTLERPNAGPVTSSLTLKNLRPDVEIAAGAFEWKSPAGAMPLSLRPLLRLNRPGQPPQAGPDYTAELPKVGATVPDFELPRPDGERFSLLRAARDKRVTLVNFWFVGCPPCRAEFPHFQKLYEELRDKGFGLVAVNRGDTRERVAEYVSTSKLTFDVVMGGTGEQYTVGRAYGVKAYPTNILIDAEGKVLWRGVGFRDPELKELREALRTAGVQ